MEFKVKAKDKRNEMHFNIQKNNRMQIWEDKTKYKRCRMKNQLRKELD